MGTVYIMNGPVNAGADASRRAAGGGEVSVVVPAVLASPFRPFGLAGAAYGVALVAAWVAALAGVDAVAAPPGWHGHEMLLGFAGAIVCAIALTALPGWAGTREVSGGALAALVALWALARAAFWAQATLSPAIAAAAAAALWVALAVLTGVQVARLADRRWWLLPVLFAALAAGAALAAVGDLRTGLALVAHVLALLFALAAGVFVPVFTRTHLRGRGEAVPAAGARLDTAAIGALVLLAGADLAAAPRWLVAGAALAACVLHALRLLRWRGWRTFDAPLLWTLHAGYAWLVAALLLRVLAEAGVAGAQRAWLHAFTVGALGSAMIGLLTRVVLRHTGRPLVVGGAARAVFLLVQVAAALRVAGAALDGGTAWPVASGAAWVAAFALYLHAYAPFLLAPSVPRARSPLGLDSRPPADAC